MVVLSQMMKKLIMRSRKGFYMNNNVTDIIKMETNIVLTDKDGNIIKVETPPPEIYEEKWW